jgi:potassium-dependent mechanosensitive channel
MALPASAQIPNLSSLIAAPASSSASAATKAPPAPATPTALPVDQIAVEADDVTGRLRDMTTDIDADETVKQISAELVPLQSDTKTRVAEVRRTLATHATVAAIHGLEPGWKHIASDANDATHDLTRRADELNHILASLEKLDGVWQATVKAAAAAQAPAEVQARAQDVVTQIEKTKTDAIAKQAEVLALQGRAADLAARANDTLGQLSTAGQRAIRDLFRHDSLPVWDDGFWASAVAAVTVQGSESLRSQFSELGGFFESHADEAALHATFLIVFLALMFFAKRKVQGLAPDDPEAVTAIKVFAAPISTSLLLACFVGYWIYRQPPQLLPMLISMAGVIPTVLVVRRLIERNLTPVLYALALFFVLDRARNVVAVSAPISRLVFVLEIVAGLVFLGWLRMASKPREDRPWTLERRWRLIRQASVIAFAISFMALVANFIGYQNLSTLLGGMLVRGGYFALLLYAITRVAQGLVLGMFYVAPFKYLSMVRQHRRLLTARLTTVIGWAAVAYWFYGMLANGGFWDIAQHSASSAFTSTLTMGSFALSLDKVVGFVVAITASYWVARFITFILDEEIYPKVHLERGLPYVISTMLRYVILVIGFIIGLALLGIDMTKFTILAGAFSVGLGFGMQNIVNNFVSGLIVLFERPLKVGDVVQFGDVVGRVERIGIRASVIRSANGAEVIIPNGTLIANNLTNWTFSSKTRRIDVPIQTVLTADPIQVKAILLDAAANFPDAAKTPAPQALLTQLGPDALGFELRIWTDAASDWASMKSDLTSAVTEALRKTGIAIK